MNFTIRKPILLVAFLWLLLPVLPAGCGSGGGDASPDQNGPESPVLSESGSLTVDDTTGVVTYESAAVELQPGLLLSRMAVLTPNDPINDALGYRATLVLKFNNTSDITQQTTYIADIPKRFAQHVNELGYKILTDQAEESTLANLLADSTPFVNIDDFVTRGAAQVLEEDPILSIPVLVVGGIAAVTAVLLQKPDWVGLTPRTAAEDVTAMSAAQRQQWINDQLLGQYCVAVRNSAAKNNIPPRLLANIILNELADYDAKDTIQELVYTGEDRSHGWAQLQPKRLRDHGLVDVGAADSIRDPNVDIDEATLTYTVPGQPGEPSITLKRSVNEALWQRLNTPEASIEFGAREVSYLLDRLKTGSPALNNPWAKALLVDPAAGVDKDDIFANLRVAGSPVSAKDRQIALDRTLAVLIAAAYNGSGAIFNVAGDDGIFTAKELKQKTVLGDDYMVQVGIPWTALNDIEDKIPGTDTFKYPFHDPRIHAENAGTLFPAALIATPCLNETMDTTPPPAFNASACPANLLGKFVHGGTTLITLPFKRFEDNWFMNEAACYYTQTEFPIPNPGRIPGLGFDTGLWFKYDGNYQGLKPGEPCPGPSGTDDVVVDKGALDSSGYAFLTVSSKVRNISVSAFYTDGIYEYDYQILLDAMKELLDNAIKARIGTCLPQ